MDTPLTTPRFTIFTTTWCHQCLAAKTWFKKHGLEAGRDFDEVNIEESAEAAATVEKLNQGYRSVPTLLMPDGRTLTEPSKDQLAAFFPLLTEIAPTV